MSTEMEGGSDGVSYVQIWPSTDGRTREWRWYRLGVDTDCVSRLTLTAASDSSVVFAPIRFDAEREFSGFVAENGLMYVDASPAVLKDDRIDIIEKLDAFSEVAHELQEKEALLRAQREGERSWLANMLGMKSETVNIDLTEVKQRVSALREDLRDTCARANERVRQNTQGDLTEVADESYRVLGATQEATIRSAQEGVVKSVTAPDSRAQLVAYMQTHREICAESFGRLSRELSSSAEELMELIAMQSCMLDEIPESSFRIKFDTLVSAAHTANFPFRASETVKDFLVHWAVWREHHAEV